MSQQSDLAAEVARMFAELSAVTRTLTMTTGGGPGGAPAIHSVEGCLITRVPAGRVDGITVLPNDELLRFATAPLLSPIYPQPGDTMVDTGDGQDRQVITAHLDPFGVMWTCIVRKVA